jgi:hypothetical protein
MDDLVEALGKVLHFASQTARELGIENQIARSKLGVMHALIEDVTRCIEAHAFGGEAPTNFKQLIGNALAQRASQET